jgi:hypothetical protein
MSTYSDGTYSSAVQSGPDVYSFDEFTRSLIVTRKMQINAASWTILALGTAGPTVSGTATKLIGESQPSNIGCGLVEWERTYAAIPGTHGTTQRSEYEDYAFGYQNVRVHYTAGVPDSLVLDGTSLVTIPIVVTSRVDYAYFDSATTAPSAVTLYKPFIVSEAEGTPYFIGDFPAESDTEIVAETSTLRRWRNSNFYERITRYVPRDAFTSTF